MNFKVGDNVIFSKENHFAARSNGYKIDKPYEIKRISDARDAIEIINEDGVGNWLLISRFEKVSKNQRIKALENDLATTKEEVAELKLIVQQLRRPSTVVEEALAQADAIIEFKGAQYKKVDLEAQEGDVVVFYGSHHLAITDRKPYKIFKHNEGFLYHKADTGTAYPLDGEYVEGYHVYELIVDDNPFDWVDEPLDEEKSPNQLRAEVIGKAKAFIEDSEGIFGDYNVKTKTGDHKMCTVEFLVNKDKRKVVALMKGYSTKRVYANGVAICAEGDVFHESIGRAIALGRALGLNVGEFVGAVQPSEVAKGQIIKCNSYGSEDEIYKVTDSEIEIQNGRSFYYKRRFGDGELTIINDTNAIYGDVE